MMEKSIKYWHAMSDPALLEMLGKYIQQVRLQQNKTQHTLLRYYERKLHTGHNNARTCEAHRQCTTLNTKR